jgi:two-component system, chemotaxis family, sensor kinase CheA
MDHGIESPGERKKAGKPGEGTILLKSFYSGANVIIQIEDDGRGIDPRKIKEKAIEKGLVSTETDPDDRELFNLLFMPGFSTAEKITGVSGRGVGMDVVKRKINDIRGEVELDSTPGKGTRIQIKLPLTLSIIDGLLVRISNTHYIVPLASVDKIYAVKHEKIANTFNNLVVLDGVQYPFFYLRPEFKVDGEAPEDEQVVVLYFEDKKIGIAVDYVVGEYQAVLKPLGVHYKGQEEVSGASILGDGSVALVLDTNKLIQKLSNRKLKMEENKNE